jgi:dynein heavy chain, axonemal
VENTKYLQTLSGLFAEMSRGTMELGELQELFMPIMHTILMIYQYSTHYNTAPRLVVLIREICNEIIRQCMGQVAGSQVKEDMKEKSSVKSALSKVTSAFEVCIKFKEAYFEYKSKVKNQWKIASSALFVRLDAFAERCQDLMLMAKTIMQFNKLDDIQIGNTKGTIFTEAVSQIFREFQAAQEKFC